MADDHVDHDDRYAISTKQRFGPLEVIDVPAMVADAGAAWSNETLTRVDGNVVRLGVVEGEFHWHRHEQEDEFFFVLEGELTVEVEGRPGVTLGPHQGYTVPKGTIHRTRAAVRTVMLMSSAAGVVPVGDTVPTGDQTGGRPAGAYERLLDLLDRHRATYRLIDHAPEGRTELVSPLRGNPLPAAAKCMIVMVKVYKKRRRHVLAVVPGDRRVDLDAVKRLYDGRYAALADTETAERLSGCAAGTILPFTWSNELDLVVDPTLYDHHTIYFNAARLDRSVALASADHRRITTPTEATITTPDAPALA
jgi:Ala-tRNA(Pro) deacylase